MTKKELEQMMKKESKRVRENFIKNPHELSWAEAMIILMGCKIEVEEKKK